MKTVLLVGHNNMSKENLTQILQENGFVVTAVNCTRQALDCCRHVLLKVVIKLTNPDDTCRYNFCLRLREITALVPLIVMANSHDNKGF